MKTKRYGYLAVTAILVACFSCSHKSDRQQFKVLLGSDTVRSALMIESTPDSALSDSVRWSNALYRIALSRSQHPVDSAESRKLADQLELKTNIHWSLVSAQILLGASRVCVSTMRTHGPMGTLTFSDSLIFARIKENTFSIVKRSGHAAFDSSLTEKKNLSPLLARLLGISDETAFIVADFARADSVSSNQVLSAGAMIQGLVFTGVPQKGKPLKHVSASIGTDAKTADGLKYRNQQSITASIGAHTQTIQGIYKKHLKMNESLAGAVWIQFSVKPDGTVADVEVRQTDIADGSFTRELLEYMRTILFAQTPASVGIMKFVFPFNFTAE